MNQILEHHPIYRSHPSDENARLDKVLEQRSERKRTEYALEHRPATSSPAGAAIRAGAAAESCNDKGTGGAAICDEAGDAASAWMNQVTRAASNRSRVMARSRDLTGQWDRPVTSGTEGAASSDTTAHAAAADDKTANKTVAWIDANGLWAAEKLGGTWQKLLVAPGVDDFRLVANASGKLALVWLQYGRNSSVAVFAATRHPGEPWSKPRVLTSSSSRHFATNDPARRNRTVVATSETHDRVHATNRGHTCGMRAVSRTANAAAV